MFRRGRRGVQDNQKTEKRVDETKQRSKTEVKDDQFTKHVIWE